MDSAATIGHAPTATGRYSIADLSAAPPKHLLELRARLRTPETAAFLTYWHGLTRRLGRLPDWEDVDPSEITSILPDSWLYEQLDGGRDFVCRLAGEHIIWRWKTPIIKRRLSEFIGPWLAPRMIAHLQRAIERNVLTYGITPTANSKGWFAERIYAPLVRHGTPCVFGCSSYVSDSSFDDHIDAHRVAAHFQLFDAVSGAYRGYEPF